MKYSTSTIVLSCLLAAAELTTAAHIKREITAACCCALAIISNPVNSISSPSSQIGNSLYEPFEFHLLRENDDLVTEFIRVLGEEANSKIEEKGARKPFSSLRKTIVGMMKEGISLVTRYLAFFVFGGEEGRYVDE